MVGFRRVTLMCLLAATALGAWPGSPIDFADALHAAQQPRPIAVAGLNQVVAGIGVLVQLDGSASSDPGGSPLTYQWTFVETPAGSDAVLAAGATARPTFVPDVKGRYRAQLVVSTASAASRPDVVVITVRNTAPSADAGDALFAAVGDLVRLDGSRSSDADGDPLTFQWSFLSKPRGSRPRFTDATAVQPTLLIDKPGRYVARLVVHDGQSRGADTVIIDVPNTPPSADAGPDRTAIAGERVVLDGSGSVDSDGDRLTYEWTLVAIPDGSAATLRNPTSIRPRFVIDRPGRYVARLIVSDGLVASAPDTVVINTGNSAPVAHAGPDLSALAGQTVQLIGSGSTDVDGDELTYQWTLLARPEGSTAVLGNPSAVNPSLQVDTRGSYTLQLIVHDGVESSSPDEVVVTVGNTAPVASAGSDRRVTVGDSVTLDGSGSTDVDGDPLVYHWSLTLVPLGSAAALNDPNAVTPTFQVDLPGTYVAQLLVADGTALSAADTVTIDTDNVAPISHAGPDQSAYVGQLVVLNGADSRDPDGAPVIFSWTFTSRPAGSNADLTGATTIGPVFTVDVAGDYVVQLIVSDGELASPPDTVTITTRANTIPVASAGADVSDVPVGSEVVLNGSASSDADGHPLTYRWALLARPVGSAAALSDPNALFPSFTADVVGDYVAQLVVGDGLNESAPDTVLIRTARPPVVANAGPDQVVEALTIVQLDGSGSSDTSGQPLTYQWSFASAPSGSQAALSSTSAVDPAFTADAAGTYELRLTVTSAFGVSATDVVTITALAAQPSVVTVVASDNSAAEAASNDGTFTITRSTPYTGSLTVSLAVAGTAMNGTDYTSVPSAVVIPDGEASVALGIAPLPDADVEGDEFVVLTLRPGNYTIGAPNSATVVITDSTLEGGTLINGANHRGSILPSGDTDTWTFVAAAGDAIALSLAEVGAIPDFMPIIRLFAPDGSLVDWSYNHVVAQVHVGAPMTGTYSVVVASNDSGLDGTGDYRLTLAHTPGAFVVPADDEGGAMTNGANHSGRIHVGDLDQWTFVAAAGDAIALSLAEVGAIPDFMPIIRLRAPNGSLVDWSYNHVVAQVHVTAPATGTYTVLVGTNDSGLDAAGDYLLTLAHTPGAFVVPTGDEGGAMTNGANHSGRIHVGDLDQWTFVAAAGDAIALSVAEAGSIPDFMPIIRLRAPNGSLVDWSYNHVVAQVHVTAPASGVYTVVIGTNDSGLDATGDYLLTLAHTPGAVVVPTGDEGGAMTNGANHTGRIHVGDLDQWTFVAAAGDAIALSVAEVGSIPDFMPIIRLRAPNGSLVDWSYNHVVAQVHVTAPATGVYTVVIGTNDSGLDATGDYLLTLAHTPGAFVVPTGDEGGAMTNGANHAGRIHVGDLDQWTFVAAAGDAIALSVAEVGSIPDFMPIIRLRAPNGSLVDWSYNHVVAQVHVTAPASGVYTVVIGTNDSGLDATGDYLLTLAHTPGAFVVPTGDEGGAMTNGATHAGRIHTGDLDQWTFIASAGATIAVSVAEVGTNPDFMPIIRLRAPNGSLVDWSYNHVVAQVNARAPATGIYTVVVGTNDSGLDAAGDYLLTLTRTP